ncbi:MULTISPECIES: replication protein RepB [Rhodococcus]|jgi:DNA-directed RNA polymerase specialized sigma24 family protein|uniref:Replication protein RepB n=3 Tax=Actinomycetes TaxID=1760 RepID=Q3L8W8_RHOE4|nr:MULTISPECIES: replication protein RepB [Rhodococcus]BAD11213.1 RepB [Expression vector pTip-NH1]BAD11219.1 RepB [Expression vector pTip-CH1]BAD11225.1 RepB [Expression vector pTip-NH2]BAD11231.1 RepB [Expression vector pTip-CH2]BAD11237.1 RepB [Expression vector pTip-LNH1]BAD11243.1 RepB [Expression vector pTip-LCH1]BAD11249.1 RepB [Expression vector pTip-LNH2]BAD11255.1 RepB [Expression vector pTip-LCH2]BAD11261.1 RepB [Expression vector pTip-NH1.2]BAD11267.1 RepB [Expression vector p
MGGAKNPVRRKMTAAAAAEKFGASTRTIQRLFAEPRDDYLGRAKARRDKAVELRKQGLKYREIAEAMELSTGIVGRLLHDARRHGEISAEDLSA